MKLSYLDSCLSKSASDIVQESREGRAVCMCIETLFLPCIVKDRHPSELEKIQDCKQLSFPPLCVHDVLHALIPEICVRLSEQENVYVR